MCGIAGMLGLGTGTGTAPDASTLRRMADALAHRGPDAEGLWRDEDAAIGLAHRRLSILDLSPAGAQPMQSADARHVIVFNGEVYNHLELRKALEAEGVASTWRGHSDTETLLAAIGHWGLDKALQRAAGMFALALWDREAGILSLARDRTGEKPLHLAMLGGAVAFASEPQAFQAIPAFDPALDPQALQGFVATATVADDRCIFASVRKVQPGTILSIAAADGAMEQRVYCDMVGVMATGLSHPARRAPDDEARVIRDMRATLEEVVASQMISDVPLGSFLSGGVDSSLVTALMTAVSDRSVKTFTIGFEEAGYDESAHAERVAAHLGTDHTTYRLTEADALEVIPQLGRIYGEPFADSSQIPTVLLCRNARQAVTVALTGDGGDEIFGGYNRHVLGPKLWSRLSRMPGLLRRGARPVGRVLQQLGGGGSPLLRGLARRAGLPASLLDKSGRLAEIAASATSLQDVYAGLTQITDDPARVLRSGPDRAATRAEDERLAGFSPKDWIMARDTLGYLPSDILVKVDRAAMHASLETRAPFLDIRTIEAAWRLPPRARIRDGRGKQILRDILDLHVPRALIDRPKQGFAIPIDRWLRGELRSWAEGLLSVEELQGQGVLQVAPVREIWSTHLAGRGNHGQLLWALLMLQSWLQDGAARPAEMAT
ncbi:asparagine synthase (glutamine-hydrolyzing) [Roseicyclus amphidinii]|uniref:asparagine synthase (glutamine-hydrolyzing) n=1 Tax=Roseicyclus amphidinii TaxID=3034232 RepID=UPI0024E14CC2|nr:asparagine synthase (glutamine-hydrolyzing) [Roseicyclus sp. Amp-Y-6]